MSTYLRNRTCVSPAPSRRFFLAGAASALAIPALPLLGADNPETRPAREAENPYLWKPRTQSVAVFKNVRIPFTIKM